MRYRLLWVACVASAVAGVVAIATWPTFRTFWAASFAFLPLAYLIGERWVSGSRGDVRSRGKEPGRNE